MSDETTKDLIKEVKKETKVILEDQEVQVDPLPEKYQQLYDEYYKMIEDQRDNSTFTLKDFFTRVADKAKEIIGIDILKYQNKKIDDNKVKNILISQFNGIGDAIILSAFIRELRRNRPDANIILVCEENTRQVYNNCPYINSIINVKVPDYEVVTLLFTAIELGKTFFWNKQPIDLVLLPHTGENNKFSLFIAYFSLAPYRVGYGENNWLAHYDPKQAVKDGMGIDGIEYDHLLLTHHVSFPATHYHEVPRRLFLLQFLGFRVSDISVETWTSNEIVQKVTDFVEPYKDRKKIVIGVGGSYITKHYPPKKYASLIERINKYEKEKPIFFIVGGPSEKQEAQEIIDNVNSDNVKMVVEEFNITETITFVRMCDMYIGNDTGAAHMAAAANKPIILIHSEGEDVWDFYPHYISSIRRFRPWTDNCVIIRPKTRLPACRGLIVHSGCGMQDTPHCITQIKVKDIFHIYKSIVENNMDANLIVNPDDKEKNGIYTV